MVLGSNISFMQIFENMLVSGTLGVIFANRLGKSIFRIEFDVDMYFHYHLQTLFGSKAHIPLLPIVNSIVSVNVFPYLWNKKQS